MANKWRQVTVGDIAASQRNALVGGPFGSNLVSRDYVESGVPVIRGQNMGKRWVSGDFVFVSDAKAASLESNIARNDDIIFTQRGTLGQVSLVPAAPYSQYVISQSQMKLTVNRELADPLFFYYVFSSSSQQEYIRQHTIQTGVPHTNLSILRNTPVPLPPLTEQHSIAQILGTLDDKIELLQAMNETLEAIARAFFSSWFVEFEPVRAKVDRRWQEGQSLPGLPQYLFDIFPDSMVIVDGAEFPKGWQPAKLTAFADLNPESWSKDTAPEVIEYVDLSNTKWGKIESTTRFNWSDAPSRARRVLRPGDTVVGTVRPANGSYALIANTGLTGSTGFACLRPRSPHDTTFVYLASTAASNVDRLAHLADGAAYPAVRPEVVISTPVVHPSLPVLQAFNKITAPLLSKIAVNNETSRTLEVMRDTLISELIEGDLQLEDPRRFATEGS